MADRSNEDLESMAQRLLDRPMTQEDVKPYRGRLLLMARSLDALDDRAAHLRPLEPALVWRVPQTRE